MVDWRFVASCLSLEHWLPRAFHVAACGHLSSVVGPTRTSGYVRFRTAVKGIADIKRAPDPHAAMASSRLTSR